VRENVLSERDQIFIGVEGTALNDEVGSRTLSERFLRILYADSLADDQGGSAARVAVLAIWVVNAIRDLAGVGHNGAGGFGEG